MHSTGIRDGDPAPRKRRLGRRHFFDRLLGASNLKLAGNVTVAFLLERQLGPVEFTAFGKISVGDKELPTGTDPFLGLVIGFDAQGNIPLGGIFFFVLGLELEIGGKIYLGGPSAGTGKLLMEIKVFAGVGFGTTRPVVKMYGFIAGGLAIERDRSGWHFGGIGLFEAEGNVIELVKVNISGEFVGIGRREPRRTITEYTGELAINVQFLFLSVRLAWGFGWEQVLGP